MLKLYIILKHGSKGRTCQFWKLKKMWFNYGVASTYYVFICLGATTDNAQELLQTQHSGITPSMEQGAI